MMAITTSILPADLGSSPSRSPLQQISITSTPKNTIRRKGSFMRLADSSEELPSSHESIFEAFCFSSSEASSNKAEIIDIPSRIPRPVKKNDENFREVSPSTLIDTVQFRYGHGTALDTITEQKSFATLRSKARTKSADTSPSIPFLGHRDSFTISKTPRRHVSFSLDDIVEIKRSYHDACAVIEQEMCKPLLAQEVYAEPKIPIQAPPDRPPTPPGMPSWTESQKLTIPRRRQPNLPKPRQNIVKKFFNLSNTVNRGGNRAVSAPVPGRAAPRFRPPKSVYGPIDQHPFNKAPIAKVSNDMPSALPKPRKRLQKNQRVRFTPSATARDSEANMLQAAIESTRTSAVHPFHPVSPTIIGSPTKRRACSHRNMKPIFTLTVEDNRIHALPPYHRSDEIAPWSPIGPSNSSNSSSPISPSQVELDSLCVTDSVRDRAPSVSSTAHLMSGALRNTTPPLPNDNTACQYAYPDLTKEKWCWKCTVQAAFDKLDEWWMKSAGCVCFVCCGFDIDEDGNVKGRRRKGSVRGSYRIEMAGPRKVVLGQTPAQNLRGIREDFLRRE